MKIFLDTADITQIKNWSNTGLIDGVTTNPTHLSKAGGDIKTLILDICKTLPDGKISVEVTETAPQNVYAQAKKIAALAKNIVVKIPCHKDYYEIIKQLADEKVKLNITLVFTLVQALFMCKLGVEYISPFIGRWDDIDVNGSELITTLRMMIDEYGFADTKIIAASIRDLRHVHNAILSGADIVTIPTTVMEKATKHPLTDQGIQKFNDDWKTLGIKQFP